MKLFSPWHRPWLILVGLLVVGISIFYGLIYRDIVSRAKESYMAAERYMEWATNPEKKKADIQNKFLASKEKLDQKKAAQKFQKKSTVRNSK